ncbi:flagellar type III secretion system pore protein FliP [Endothiovibrio diazotrophicus]
MIRWILLLSLLLLPAEWAWARPAIDAVMVTTDPNGGQTYSMTIQALAVLTILGLLPSILIMMTAFTRIVIVLAIVRQASGLNSAPNNQVLVGIALFLTFFVMSPVFDQAYTDGVAPYLDEKIGVEEAVKRAAVPFRAFMLGQTREKELETFGRISGRQDMNGPDDVPWSVLIPAFVTSEMKTAFQMGFMIFIPFLVIDLVVASTLMAMGMMMLSPMMISIPFKIMLFVLVDGWMLIVSTLAQSFYI